MPPYADLMCAASAGDTNAFSELVRRHAGALLRFVTRIEGDAHRAEDVVQDALLATWKHRQQFDPSRSFKSWLYRIAVNRCRELHRRQLKSPAANCELDSTPASDESPADSVIATESATHVLRHVDGLPAAQRAVVIMRVWDGLHYAEIGYALGISEGTARSNMHHALAALRRALKPDDLVGESHVRRS